MLKLLAVLGLVTTAAWCAHGPEKHRAASSVTVLVDFEQSHYSESALRVMEREASSLLRDSGVQLEWRLRSEVPPGAQFGEVVSFHLRGSCSTDTEPVNVDERGPLAMAYTSNGTVLHFGEVECDRIKVSLRRALLGSEYLCADGLLGRALGRVIAHEMFHILCNEVGHTKDGVTRRSLTAAELFGNGALFPDQASQEVMQQYKGD